MTKNERANFNALIKRLQNESDKRQAADLAELRKPYYFKGRFNSLKDSDKKRKIKEYYKQEKQATAEELKRLYQVEEWREFSACVEWTRSQTWGANPHAKASANARRCGFGSASGCGYDKLSAAICYAVNDSQEASDIIKGALIRSHCRTGQPFPYGVYITNKIYLHFDGCGVSTLREIANFCGLKNWQHYETKQSDFIIISK